MSQLRMPDDRHTHNSTRVIPNPSLLALSPAEKIEQLRIDANVACRIDEEAAILWFALAEIVTSLFVANDDEVTAICNFVGAVSALLLASGYLAYRKHLPKWLVTRLSLHKHPLPQNNTDIENNHSAKKGGEKKENPWSRIWKTSYTVGKSVGDLIGHFVPLPRVADVHLPSKLFGFVLGIVFGVGGMLFFREDLVEKEAPLYLEDNEEKGNEAKFSRKLINKLSGLLLFKKALSEKQKTLLKLGKEGWTKYGKTGLVYGGAVGSLIGYLLGQFLPGLGAPLVTAAIGTGIGNVVGFVAAVTFVPVFNYFKINHLPKNDWPQLHEIFDNYRSNYIRAGSTLFSSLFALIFGLLGTFLIPGLGTLGGMALGGAAGAVLGGLVFGIGCSFWRKHVENDRVANSYDYAIRTGEMVGGKMGIGEALKPIPIIGPVATAICGLMTSTGGGAYEAYNANQLEKQNKTEQNYILPWTQRVATGVMIGSAVGGFIGFFTFGPLGMLIGSGVGGALGALAAIMIEPLLRRAKIIPSISENPASSDHLNVTEDHDAEENRYTIEAETTPLSAPISRSSSIDSFSVAKPDSLNTKEDHDAKEGRNTNQAMTHSFTTPPSINPSLSVSSSSAPHESVPAQGEDKYFSEKGRLVFFSSVQKRKHLSISPQEPITSADEEVPQHRIKKIRYTS